MTAEPKLESQWIEYKGKRIWQSDWSNLEGQEFTQAVQRGRATILEQIEAGATELLTLIIVTEAIANADTLREFRKNSEAVLQHSKGSAVIGLDAMKKHLLRFINVMSPVKTRPFDSREEALEWLVGL